MIYEYFIIFITVLIVYTTFEPPAVDPVQTGMRWVASLLVFTVYGVLVGVVFKRLAGLAAGNSVALGLIQKRYRRCLTWFSILAMACFTFHVYVLNVKADFQALPWSRSFPTLSSFLALCVFFAYLIVMWWSAYPLARRLFGLEWTRSSFVLARLRLYGSILAPWFILSCTTDVMELTAFNPLARLGAFTQEIVFFGTFVGLFAVFGPVLIRYFWGLAPLPPGPVRNHIEGECIRNHFRYRDIMLWPLFERELLTAGVMGIISRFRYIMISPSLLNLLNSEELTGVLAHEIGHIKRKHMLYYMFLIMGYVVLVYPLFTIFALLAPYSDTLISLVTSSSPSETTRLSLLLTIPMLGGFVLYFRFVFGYFMRNFERQADLFSLQQTGNAEALTRSLEKIAYFSGTPPGTPSWHHFSVRERIETLNRATFEPRLIPAHDSKIKRSIWLYVSVVLVVGVGAYVLEQSPVRAALERVSVEKALTRYIEHHPDDANALSMLGSLYFEQKRFGDAEHSYQAALDINPVDPETLNNLAWLYATSEDPAFSKPKEALDLAEKAARLKPAPHILDTLAESYYRNGRFDEAVLQAEDILRLPLEDRSYFEEQLAKFRRALEEAKENGSNTPMEWHRTRSGAGIPRRAECAGGSPHP
ncbi:MAG: M48 family metalloprotease [Deltaproteobacteria bacterium]|nr:M48 family metalloprotease [Deltaproteobacteria bacterium]